MEVHAQLGHGFLEAVYQEALALELEARGIPFQREVVLPVFYKEQRLSCSYRADFICYDDLVLELKATAKLTGADESQAINELKATGMNRAILLNFDSPSLEYKRLVQNIWSSAKQTTAAENAVIDLRN